jgi:hypothetical protein
MSDNSPVTELVKMRDWAEAQLAQGDQEVWRAFLLARLSETIGGLLAGHAATRADEAVITAHDRPPLRLVVSDVRQDVDDVLGQYVRWVFPATEERHR